MQACRARMLFQPAMSEGTAGFFLFQAPPEAAFLYAEIRIQPDGQKRLQYSLTFDIKIDNRQEDVISPAFCRHERGLSAKRRRRSGAQYEARKSSWNKALMMASCRLGRKEKCGETLQKKDRGRHRPLPNGRRARHFRIHAVQTDMKKADDVPFFRRQPFLGCSQFVMTRDQPHHFLAFEEQHMTFFYSLRN